MKRILILLFSMFIICDVQAQSSPFKALKDVGDYVTDSIKKRPDKITANTLNKAFQGIVTFAPDIVQDTASISSPKHGKMVYQRKDSTAYVYDSTTTIKRWRKFTTATGTIVGDTARVRAFSTVAALKASSYYALGGDLVAEILDGGRRFKWNPSSTISDDGGVTSIQVTGVTTGRFERIFRGPVRADEVGVKTDNTDQTTLLNALALNSFVKEIVIDADSVKISGTFDAKGKRIVFRNGAKLIGTGTIQNMYVVAETSVKIFDTTLNTDNGLLNSEVSVKWWGANPDFLFGTTYSQTKTNNLKAFTRAKDGVKNKATYAYYREGSKIYIPSGVDIDHLYYLDSTWTLDRNIEVYGDGIDQSGLVFPHGVVGIHLQSSHSADTSIKGGSNGFLHDFKIWGNNTQSDWTFDDGKSFGILVQQNKATLQRVKVEGFGSNGFYVFAFVPNHNANNCFFNDCVGYYNGGFGWKAKSTDANKCVILKGDYSYNVRGGVCDSSFLGNSQSDVHTASNVVLSPHNKAFVTYLGNRFICKTDGLIGVAPPSTGVSSTNWWFSGTGGTLGSYITDYSPDSTYWEGAAFKWADGNQGGICSSLYIEGDQWAGDASNTNIMVFNSTPGLLGQSIWKTNGSLRTPAILADETTFGGWRPGIFGKERYIGWQDESRAGTLHGFKYYGDANIWRVNSANDDNTNASFFGYGYGASHFGLTTMPYAGIAFDKGAWFDQRLNSHNYRLIGLRDSITAPAYGEWATGDILIYNGTDTASHVIGFKCISGGIHGTWAILTSGSGGSGGGGNTNSNIGSGYRLAIPNTNNIKTLFGSYAFNLDSALNANGITYTIDTTLMSTRAYLKHKIDSLAALSSGSVAYGLTTQFPYTNTSGNGFLYSANGTYDGVTMTLKGSASTGNILNIQQVSAGGTGTDPTLTFIHANPSLKMGMWLDNGGADLNAGIPGTTPNWKLMRGTGNSLFHGTNDIGYRVQIFGSGTGGGGLYVEDSIKNDVLGTTGNRIVGRNARSKLYDTGIDPANVITKAMLTDSLNARGGGGGSSSTITNRGTGDTMLVNVSTDTLGVKSLNVHSSDGTIDVNKTITSTDIDYDVTVHRSLVIIDDADYTISAGVTNIILSHTTTGRTFTLPDPTTNTNRIITITHSGNVGNLLTYSRTIRTNSTTTHTTLTQGQVETIMSDGTQWWSISVK